MNVRRTLSITAVAVGLLAGPATIAPAQETPIPRDDALDSLLEKLSDPSGSAGKTVQKPSGATKGGPDAKRVPEVKKPAPDAAKNAGNTGKKSQAPARLSGKDQEVDELLEKLGETVEKPAPDDRPRGAAGGGEKPDGPPSRPGKKDDRDRLTGKDKETDEHLEELTGRKRRRKQDDGQRTGAAGEIIKEMRDIEQKLNKPDTGEATRGEQKKVVKRIEKLIEQVRQSGQSGMRGIRIRRVNRPGQQPGQQPDRTGALAQGAPPMKPKRPTTKHANVGGKDEWGHLPPELRQEAQNSMSEQPLSTRESLIDRYYLSVAKGKPKREETP